MFFYYFQPDIDKFISVWVASFCSSPLSSISELCYRWRCYPGCRRRQL